MNSFSKVFPLATKEGSRSWAMVLAFAFIVVFAQGIAGYYLSSLDINKPLVLVRYLHGMSGILSILLLLLFKKFWTTRKLFWLFIGLALPFYYTSWFSQIVYAASPKMFVPFLPFKLYPLVLAFLVPGSYWVNFIMMILFYTQAVILWFYLDVPNLKNIILSSEPLVSILFACVSFILFYFRYNDEKAIRDLSIKKTQAEYHMNMAKIFLSIRDRTNTPLQMQKIISELLKIKYPEENDLVPKLDHSIDELATMMELLGRFAPNVADYNLMSDNEIMEYLDKLDSKEKNQ